MTITSYYKNLLNDKFVADPAQEKIIAQLQVIQDELLAELRKRKRLKLLRKPHLVKGLYLWGGVGVGKTFLLDCFYESFASPAKLRMHFFQFMRFVHDELRKHTGKKNPLVHIAKRLAKQVIVLCFDEFFVKDIVDAMLLGELLQLLFKEGICIITTSNIAPDKLYERGLQRGNFLPAIAALKKHLHVIHLAGNTDYRLRSVQAEGVFFVPHDEKAEAAMQHSFSILSHGDTISNEPITIANRDIRVKQKTAQAIWFHFNDICHVPRSQQDYLFLAEHYPFIFVSEIPHISQHEKNTIRLFIMLIDVLYDQHSKFIFSANTDIASIYTAGDMLFEFARTKSRLIEMQSAAYFTT